LAEEIQGITLDFNECQAIIDLPDPTKLTRNELDTILKRLNDLETTYGKHIDSMNFREQIEFLLTNRIINIIPPHGLEVVTMVEGEVQSISHVEIKGDIKYIQAQINLPGIHEFLTQVHQTTVKLYMQSWRKKVMQHYLAVRVIFKTLRNIQIFSTILAMFVGVEGLITQSSTILISSTIPLFLVIILFLVKKSLK
jgi:hypothetical protein